MKYLSESYRESMLGHFAKNGKLYMFYVFVVSCRCSQSWQLNYIFCCNILGIPWHILVYCIVFKDDTGIWKRLNQVHVTVMENSEKQDSSTNMAITKASLKIFAKANPQVKTCIIKSDNAG